MTTTPTTSTTHETSTVSFNIEFICSLIPKEFNGNRFELGQFVANCNNASQLASPTQKTPLLYFILSKISGRAKEQLAQQTFSTWDELKIKLKSLYQDKKHFTQIMEELNNTKQNFNESIADYYQKLETLNSRALSAAQQNTTDPTILPGKIQTINEITLNRFVYHSIPSISQMLRWKEFDNLNSAYTAALAEERALNIQNLRKNRFCNICRNTNHDTSQCRSKRQSKQNEQVNFSHQTQNTKICRYCKKSGHLIEECRKRQFNNTKNNKHNNRIHFSPHQNSLSRSPASTNHPLPNENIHLNSQTPSGQNTPLEEQISQLSVFEH